MCNGLICNAKSAIQFAVQLPSRYRHVSRKPTDNGSPSLRGNAMLNSQSSIPVA
jgi:hypothetical protein